MTYGEGKAFYGLNTFTSESSNLSIGGDTLVDSKLLLGLAISYDTSDSVHTGGSALGFQGSDGYTIAPYMGYLISNNMLVDLTAGYADIENNIFDSVGISSVDSERVFVEANLNYFTMFGSDVELSASAGILWAEEDTDAYVSANSGALAASSNELTQAKLGVNLTKTAGKFTPYASLYYNYDIDTDSPFVSAGCTEAVGCYDVTNDKDDFFASLGSSYQIDNGVSAGFEMQTRFGREYSDEVNFAANIRVDM